MILSNVARSQMTACWALSLTLPLDHFFFLAALPWPDAAGAFACVQEGSRQ